MTEAGSVFSICPSRTNIWGEPKTELDGGTVTDDIIFTGRRWCEILTPEKQVGVSGASLGNFFFQ